MVSAQLLWITLCRCLGLTPPQKLKFPRLIISISGISGALSILNLDETTEHLIASQKIPAKTEKREALIALHLHVSSVNRWKKTGELGAAGVLDQKPQMTSLYLWLHRQYVCTLFSKNFHNYWKLRTDSKQITNLLSVICKFNEAS